jgi:hypothetical protein
MDLLLTLCYDGRTVLIISSNWEPDLAVATVIQQLHLVKPNKPL